MLASRIDFNPQVGVHNADSWRPIADAMEELMHSLLERNAVPLARRKYLSDLNISSADTEGRACRPLRKNGTRGNEISAIRIF